MLEERSGNGTEFAALRHLLVGPEQQQLDALADRVEEIRTPQSLAAGTATGFKFFAPNPEALRSAIVRCVAAYHDPTVWRALQRNGMARDFGWDAAAREYTALYERIASR